MMLETPLSEDLIGELFPLWQSVFGPGPHDIGADVFRGAEEDHCRSTLFTHVEAGAVVGTCFSMHSRLLPVAGFGEVATRPDHRGRGIASALCGQAVEDFLAHDGEVFFLGTGNPDAARIYHRLGWRKIVGNNVMAYVTSGRSPEEYLVDYFRKPGSVTVHAAGPAVRVPMIALMTTPHDWQVLDANVASYSCRYVLQTSCMGLYPRYVRGTAGKGAFFTATTEDGRVVGLSSVVQAEDGVCTVDGFVHGKFETVWPDLIEAACDWGNTCAHSGDGCARLEVRVAVEDEHKREAFGRIGFSERGSGEPFELNGREVASWIMSRS